MDIISINLSTTKTKLAKKQVIYRSNQQACGFYYLASGMVGLYRITESGKEHLLRVYGEGDYFGYRSLFSQEPYHLTTRSLLPSVIHHVHVKDVQELQAQAPEILQFLLKSVCRELGEAEGRFSNVAAYQTKVRVIDAIVELFQKFDFYPWTSREIAEYSGTETQTVIRFCKLLKEKNLLDPNARGIRPLDIEGLKQLRNELV